MNPTARTLPRFLKYAIFLTGLVSFVAILLPVVEKGAPTPAGKIGFLAAAFSALVGAVYLVGLRTFLSGYDRAELKIVFGPFVAANIAIAAVFLSLVVFVLVDRNIFRV